MTGVPTNLPFPFLSGSVDLILTSKLISNLISYIPEKEAALTQLAQSSGLVILVQNGCSFCGLMAPVIHRLQEETGFNVLAVTIKGGIPQEWPVAKPDNGIVKRLMTLSGSVPTVTPAIFLVDRKGEQAQLIASGALSLEDLKDRLVQASGLSRPANSSIQTLPRF